MAAGAVSDDGNGGKLTGSDETLVAPPGPVCVTGATGYIGSWLVRSLLQKGYVVHATAREPGKMKDILYLPDTNDRLKVFKADLNKEGSFDEAVKGCVGVYHVAAPMVINPSAEEIIDKYVETVILEPALRGTINVLEACWKAGSVKRVVFTSSISTITGKDENERWKSMIDESSLISIGDVWKRKPPGWVYILLKLLTEQKAIDFAKQKGISLVSIVPPTVAGAFLTNSMPSSVQVLMSPVTGDPVFHGLLKSVHSRLGSFPLVHIEDICNAHIFLMEHAAAKGRYICVAGSCSMSQLLKYLLAEYASCNSTRTSNRDSFPTISSKRLTDLGFKFKYDIEGIIKESVSACIRYGFLRSPSNSLELH